MQSTIVYGISLLILVNNFQVHALTTFGKTPALQKIETEDSKSDAQSAIIELKQLIDDNKREVELELELIKTLTLRQNDLLEKALETKNANNAARRDDVNSCSNLKTTYKSCDFAMSDENNQDGLYLLSSAPLAAYCQRFESRGWTVIFRRNYAAAPIDSQHLHNWDSYRNGFGNLNGDYWLGLETLHQLTKAWNFELWLQLKFVDGTIVNLRNGYFKVGSESDGYKLEKGLDLKSTNSDIYGDILFKNYDMKFSTYDQDNDEAELNCAKTMGFAWWYNKCEDVGLLGKYLKFRKTNSDGEDQTEVKELAYIQMAITILDL